MNTVKKLILSLGVILVFIAYSYQQRHDDVQSVIAPLTTPSSFENSSSSKSKSLVARKSSAASSSSGSRSTSNTARYRDGSYIGDVEDAFYGNIQVKVNIKSGKIVDVVFLQYPNDRENSIYINTQAMPYLRQEAIQAQNSHVNIITGATDSSMAFMQSLATALSRA